MTLAALTLSRAGIGAIALAASMMIQTASHATELVAIVEEASPVTTDVSPFLMLEAGQTIKLAPNGRLVVSYFASCLRETITGGVVTVGTSQSEVAQGTVERTRVPCDGGTLNLKRAESGKSATVVFRDPPKTLEALRAIARRIYSEHPIIFAPLCRVVRIERLDSPASPIEIEVHDSWIDLTATGTKLQQGGLYRLSGGRHDTYIVIEPAPAGEATTLLSRLVAL